MKEAGRGDGAGGQIAMPSYAGDKKPKAAGRSKQQQWVRVATVFAYFLCVSLAAVILVIYYGVIWEPSASGNSTKVSPTRPPPPPCFSLARNATAGPAGPEDRGRAGRSRRGVPARRQAADRSRNETGTAAAADRKQPGERTLDGRRR
ncbi:putative transmembrane protein INAFM1 [Rhinatrema bivittatum]|uniref:putative transmembrane protein INAFM1 n=1 Tax=Rhinatrema bivittatum TaxID=194408 RepID=UPI00112AE5F1|nr:putative transmembrane protein INAFM1 [Rhinatrema bivittatum]